MQKFTMFVKYIKDKNIVKLGIIVIIQVNTEVLHTVYVI